MKSNYDILLGKLDEFIRKYYKNLLIKGTIYSTGLSILFYLFITLAEYFGHFDTLPRAILFYLFIFTILYILSRFIIAPLLKLNKIGKIISNEQAAAIIGRHFADVDDKLINTLQLREQELIGGIPGQRDLIEASINQRIKELKPVPFSSAINFASNKKHLKFAIVPMALFVFILFSNSSIITESTKRIIRHNTYFEKEAPFHFEITNSELKAIQHEDFELNVKVNGDELPENAYIQVDGNEYKLNKENKTRFSYLFKNIQKNIHFRFTADGFNSREYILSALPNPTLLNFDVSLNYPKYIGKKDEILKNTGDLIIPAGTKITWNFATQNTSILKMNFNDTFFILKPSAENVYTYTGKFLSGRSYSLNTANEYIKSKDSVLYSINVVPDLYPEIEVEEKADSVEMKTIYFRGAIKDDYGFSGLTFTFQFIDKKDSLGNEVKIPGKTVALPVTKTIANDHFFHSWNFSGEDIRPGDRIEYYFEVRDNDGVNGAKSTRSKRMIFKAPTLKELEIKEDENNAQIKDDIEESIKKAKTLQKDLNDLNKKIFEKKNLNWEDKKKMQDILNQQKELQRQVEKAQQENQKNIQEQSEYRKPDEALLEKQQQLEELFNNIMSEEMKKLFREIEKMMEKLDKEKVQDAIEKMKLSNKDIEKELDRTLEIFKEMEVEKKLDDAIQKIDNLSQKQKDISEKSLEKNADSKALEQKQEELNKEFEEVKKEMKDLEKKNSELEQPNKIPQTEQKQQDIEKDMKESSQSLGKKQNKSASKSQKDASKKMDEMKQELAAAQEQMAQESAIEDIDALRDILENLVKLSFDQEALMLDLSKTKTDNPQYVKLNQKQKKLQDDSKMIEDSILALSKRVPQIKSFVNREISAINMSMEKAIEAMAERQSSEASQRQQFSMTSINNLALLLNDALQEMQAKNAEKKKGKNSSCNKPGNNTGQKKGMAKLSQMQQQLNQQLQKMKDQMGKAPEKNGKRNSGGTNGMSEELAKMAAQQEAIRRELQKMANELNKDNKQGTGSKMAGEMAQQMEETETDLVNKRISQETIRRQQEILTRLLESEKAEREREMDEKRKSNEAKNENLSNPNEFFEYNLHKTKEAELLKTVPPSLAPFYKMKVAEYFNRFEEKTH